MLVHRLVRDIPEWWDPDHPLAERSRDAAIRDCALLAPRSTPGTYKLLDMLPMETLVALELWRQQREERVHTNRKRINKVHGPLRDRQWNPTV